MQINNRKLWINSIITSLQAELEVIRQDNLASRNAENINETKERLNHLLLDYKSKLNYKPFESQRFL
jgi:hypothetical protein